LWPGIFTGCNPKIGYAGHGLYANISSTVVFVAKGGKVLLQKGYGYKDFANKKLE
jgi:hypothetical protein